jgi:two-component system chemotaxis sensor kinase CheA
LQGEISIRSKDGGGTSVSISVPLSVATHHVALVSAARQTFAILTPGIERLCRFKLRDVVSIQGRETIQVDDQRVPLVLLADLLGLHAGPEPVKPEPGETQFIRAVLLRSGQERLAVVVNALVDERQVVVMDLGLPAAKSGNAAGGVVLEDGTVAIVLSPTDLIAAYRQAGRGSSFLVTPPETAREQATILVVDDSITTRALEKSILEAHGYRVRVAVDGIEALELLHAEKADAVIADLMMPRLDGFGLLQAIKKDPHLADIPVLIVSSIERPEDQERGLALGADAYIVKRKFDQRELLEMVRQIL